MTETPQSNASPSSSELIARLDLMEAMMKEGRQSTHYMGWVGVLWGFAYLIALGWSSLPGFHSALAWSVTMSAALVISILTPKKHGPSTQMGRSMGAIWTSVGSALFLYCFTVTISGHFEAHSFLAAVETLLGVAHLTSALLLRWRIQFFVALVWWGAAVATCFVATTVITPIFVAAILLGNIAFGFYLMYCQRRDRQLSVHHA